VSETNLAKYRNIVLEDKHLQNEGWHRGVELFFIAHTAFLSLIITITTVHHEKPRLLGLTSSDTPDEHDLVWPTTRRQTTTESKGPQTISVSWCDIIPVAPSHTLEV